MHCQRGFNPSPPQKDSPPMLSSSGSSGSQRRSHLNRPCLNRPPVQVLVLDPILAPPVTSCAPPQVVLLHQGVHPDEALLVFLSEKGNRRAMIGSWSQVSRGVRSIPASSNTKPHLCLTCLVRPSGTPKAGVLFPSQSVAHTNRFTINLTPNPVSRSSPPNLKSNT